MGDEGVGAFADLLIVQIHLRKIVQPLEDQLPFALALFGGQEIPLELPAVKFIFPEAIDVFAEEGIGLLARALQIDFHIARHLGGNTFPRPAQIIQAVFRFLGFQGVIERPIAVEAQRLHRVFLLYIMHIMR